MGKTMYVVGQFKKEYNAGAAWDFKGLFESEKEAIGVCTAKNHFVAPVTVGRILPDETTDWPGLFYPFKEKT